MPKHLTKEHRRQCIRLRVDENLSTPTIARRVGISNHSAYKFLKDHPWTPTRKKASRGIAWSNEDVARLREVYPTLDREEILPLFLGRRWASIVRHASSLRIRRPPPDFRKSRRPIHPLMRQLRNERVRLGVTRPEVSAKCGYHINQILVWENGKAIPKLNHFMDYAQALGYEIIVRPTAETLLAQSARPLDKRQLMAGRA